MRDLILFFVAMLANTGSQTPEPPDTAAATTPAAPTQQVAEDQTPTGRFTTATEIRPILGATRANWIATRDWDGNSLIYVTHLWAWRCGLLSVEISVNGAPFTPWPLPECHLDQPTPNAILDNDGLPYRTFELGSLNRIDVIITYDDLGKEAASFNGAGLLLP